MAPRRAVLAATLVALALRAAIGLALPVRPVWDGAVYERAATQIARGEGFTLRALRPSAPPHPTAFYPIGWPAALALFRAAGAPRALDPLLQALLGALAVPLAAKLAGCLSGRSAASCAAWLVALWPGGLLASTSWMSEPLFGVLLLAAVAVAAQRSGAPALLASATLFALASYVRPTALAMAPPVIAIAAWSRRGSYGSRVARSAALAVAALALALVVLAPWMARNTAMLGGAVVSTNGGANLLVGTASSRFMHVPEPLDCPRGMRELERDRCRRDRALTRIAHDPVTWLARAPAKLVHTFAYESSSVIQLAEALGVRNPLGQPAVWAAIAACTAYWLALVALAARGLAHTRRRARLIALAPCVVTAFVHAAYFGGDRYHVPLVPIVAALAAARLARTRRLNTLHASRRDRRYAPRAASA